MADDGGRVCVGILVLCCDGVGRVVVVLDFFFCKQKTAYEMRISDWSSDVCSSDLTYSTTPIATAKPAMNRMRRTRCRVGDTGISISSDMDHPRSAAQSPPARFSFMQTGRASCRERACQYV